MCGTKKGPATTPRHCCCFCCGVVLLRRDGILETKGIPHIAQALPRRYPHPGTKSPATPSTGVVSTLCIAVYLHREHHHQFLDADSERCIPMHRSDQHLVSRGSGGSLTGDRQLRSSWLLLARSCAETQRRGGGEMDIPAVLPSLGCSECAMQKHRTQATGRDNTGKPKLHVALLKKATEYSSKPFFKQQTRKSEQTI